MSSDCGCSEPHAETPISWEQASQWIAEGTDESLGKLDRSCAETKEYKAAMAKVMDEYCSKADYLRIKEFGAPAKPGPDGKLVAGELPTPSDGHLLTAWQKNDFPYNLEPGIEHFLLWSTQPLEEEDIQKAIKERFPGKETAHWVNPPSQRSVPKLWHSQVLVRQEVPTGKSEQ